MTIDWKYTRTGATTLDDIPRIRAQFVSENRYDQVSVPIVAFCNNPFDTGKAVLEIIAAASALSLNKVYNTLDVNADCAKKVDFPQDPGADLADQYLKFLWEKTGEEPHVKLQKVPAMIAPNADSKQVLGEAIATALSGDKKSGWTVTFIST